MLKNSWVGGVIDALYDGIERFCWKDRGGALSLR